MDARKAQDLIKHVVQDRDYGVGAMEKVSLADAVYFMSRLLPECIKDAIVEGNSNDEGYFLKIEELFKPIVAKKVREAEHLWIAYSGLTGYPYYVDGAMMVLYDYSACKEIEERLGQAGYQVTFGVVDKEIFKVEVGHMYRNGYKKIKLTDGKGQPYELEREELYAYEDFFKEDYITNPGLQAAMLDFFQEIRKQAPTKGREDMLARREARMLEALVNSEFMVPCVKNESEEEVSIEHPYIDISERLEEKPEEPVIALPVFTDGFEMNKCYEGHHENMLYQFKDIVGLVEELGAAGIIINCLGISYFMKAEHINKIATKLRIK